MADAPQGPGLFGDLAPKQDKPFVRPAPASNRMSGLAAALDPRIRLGTSSWSFPGWQGLVWGGRYQPAELSREGLAAYAAHPLLRTVSLDRTYYQPLAEAGYLDMADRVDEDFRFVVKAHEDVTVARFPSHPRYGERAGRDNPRFLDAAYASDVVVGPAVDGLGDRLGAIVFQFPPQADALVGGAERFVESLYRLLRELPVGPVYAIEVRNPGWLVPRYSKALQHGGGVHCFSVHPRLPDLVSQAARVDASVCRPLICRWNLGHGRDYEGAKADYAPFNRMVAPDEPTRDALATLLAEHAEDDCYVTINNKAEGSAPLSVAALAERIVSG